MAASRRIRVAVVYGGRSGEHEVSLLSAASVVRQLDPERFEVVLVAIDKEGRWHLGDLSQVDPSSKTLPVWKDAPSVVLPPHPSYEAPRLWVLSGGDASGAGKKTEVPFDVLFPVMHGTNCEDGTLQGLLELGGVAYVGCGVLASSVGMDKDVAKRLARDAGLPIVPFVSLRPWQWTLASAQVRDETRERIQRELGFPVFVKPSNSGSSVGVHKVKEASGLDAAIQDAFRYDSKVLVEKGIAAREIELAVLESLDPAQPPQVSVAGEIVPTHEFYSYEAKYLDENGAHLKLPADLTAEQLKAAQDLARDLFVALECEGMARVDLFMDRNTGALYFNEVNTLPGFTQISMYPKLWQASGLSYRDLLTRLVELALARHERRGQLLREYVPS